MSGVIESMSAATRVRQRGKASWFSEGSAEIIDLNAEIQALQARKEFLATEAGMRVVSGDAQYHQDVADGLVESRAWKKYKSRLRSINRDRKRNKASSSSGPAIPPDRATEPEAHGSSTEDFMPGMEADPPALRKRKALVQVDSDEWLSMHDSHAAPGSSAIAGVRFNISGEDTQSDGDEPAPPRRRRHVPPPMQEVTSHRTAKNAATIR